MLRKLILPPKLFFIALACIGAVVGAEFLGDYIHRRNSIAYDGLATPIGLVKGEDDEKGKTRAAIEIEYDGGKTAKLYDGDAILSFAEDPKAPLTVRVNKLGRAELKKD